MLDQIPAGTFCAFSRKELVILALLNFYERVFDPRDPADATPTVSVLTRALKYLKEEMDVAHYGYDDEYGLFYEAMYADGREKLSPASVQSVLPREAKNGRYVRRVLIQRYSYGNDTPTFQYVLTPEGISETNELTNSFSAILDSSLRTHLILSRNRSDGKIRGWSKARERRLRPEWMYQNQVGIRVIEREDRTHYCTVLSKNTPGAEDFPHFVGWFDGWAFVSEEVPNEFAYFMLLHEVIEHTELAHMSGRCVAALREELSCVPYMRRAEYIAYRRERFEQLVAYSDESPHISEEEKTERRASLEYLRAL